MSRKPNYFNQAVAVLKRLHEAYPTFSIGRHLSSALSEYGDSWGMTDKEMVFALEKYEAELESNITSESELERIIREGQNLDTILNEEDDEDEDF